MKNGACFIVLSFVLPIITLFIGFQTSESGYKRLMDDAGIRLDRHYIEIDGVRSNWVDVVYLDKKTK